MGEFIEVTNGIELEVEEGMVTFVNNELLDICSRIKKVVSLDNKRLSKVNIAFKYHGKYFILTDKKELFRLKKSIMHDFNIIDIGKDHDCKCNVFRPKVFKQNENTYGLVKRNFGFGKVVHTCEHIA